MMPWENNDYKAAALLIGIIIVAIVIGLYITSQYRAEQDPLKFQENQTATNQPIHGAKLDVQKPIIALSAPGSILSSVTFSSFLISLLGVGTSQISSWNLVSPLANLITLHFIQRFWQSS
jgi:hypothetical protein